MLKDRTYIRVILPLRLDWEPYYYVPAEMAKEGLAAGMRVSVLFARKKYLGVVSAAGIEPDVEEGKINAVLSLERGLETITANELELWRFVSGYYLCTVGEVYKAAYPQLKVDKEVADAKREEKRLSVIDRKLQALASRKDRLSAFLEKSGRRQNARSQILRRRSFRMRRKNMPPRFRLWSSPCQCWRMRKCQVRTMCDASNPHMRCR